MTWYEILPRILNMSLTASVIICFVLLGRLILKRSPKIYSYVLWSVVMFRLLCPVTLSAPFSVLGLLDTPVVERSTEDTDKAAVVTTSLVAYIPGDIVHTEYPEITLPAPVAGEAVSDMINESLPRGEEQLRADPLEAPITIATWMWILGILGMIAGGIISYLRLRNSLVGALKLRENIYVADDISGPFVLGIVRPKIYLPSALNEKEHGYIILHEKYHIRRGDHLFKLLAYAALCIHWFNPLVWLAFKLYVKDMEMSCDEAVIRKLGENIRADYSASLLQIATGRQILFGAPLAFGEAEPSGRIRNLSRWKRPTVIASIFAAVVCIIGVVVCSLNPLVARDSLRMVKQESPVMGNEVVYEVELGKQVQEANVYAEVWENGECMYLACLPMDERAKVLHLRMKERREDGIMTGVDIQLNTDVPGGTQVAYAEFPQENSFMGYAFNAYEEGDTVSVLSGEEKILAAMVFDAGEGVRVFDPETLMNEPERLEQAEYMVVIRAVFDEESRRDVPAEEAFVLSENIPEGDTINNDSSQQLPDVGEDELLINNILLKHQPDPDKVSIRVQPSVLRNYPSYYYTPEGEDQQWLLDYMETLPAEGEAYARRWDGLQETGWQIAWQDKLFMVFEGGYIYFSYRDAELGMLEIFAEEPKLCDYIQIMLQEKLGYYTFEPADIKDIVSAQLEVQSAATDGKYHTQTITDTETLQRMEFWFGQADYMFGGADCCNEQACLTLTLQNGKKVRLSVATDSCPNFGINGVYYDYRPENEWDNRTFFELFDEIPWEWIEENTSGKGLDDASDLVYREYANGVDMTEGTTVEISKIVIEAAVEGPKSVLIVYNAKEHREILYQGKDMTFEIPQNGNYAFLVSGKDGIKTDITEAVAAYVPAEGVVQPANGEAAWQKKKIQVYHGGNEDVRPSEMIEEDAECIFDLLGSADWNEEGTTDCLSDWLFLIDERRISYHSDCGTFNDWEAECFLRLDEKTQNAVDALLKKYVRVGAVEIPIEEVTE